MKTKKVTLKEFKELVKNIIKEESSNPLKNKIMSYLQRLHGSEFDEFAAEAALYWYGYGYHGGQSSDLYSILSTSEYKPSRLANGIEDEDETAQMYYDDIVSQFEGGMQESVKPKTQKIKLSEVRELVKSMLKENQINEISSDTFNSAIDKSKQRGTNKRTERMGTLYFNKFIGKPLVNGYIENITVSNHSEGGGKFVLIHLKGDKLGIVIKYNVNEDNYRINGYPIEEIERKDAVILSKIAQHINPNTKYKNVSTSFKLKGY
jgi:hypothetical protein